MPSGYRKTFVKRISDEIEVSTTQSPLECLIEPFTKPNKYQTYSMIGNEGECVGMFGVNLDGVVWMIGSDLLYSRYLRQFFEPDETLDRRSPR